MVLDIFMEASLTLLSWIIFNNLQIRTLQWASDEEFGLHLPLQQSPKEIEAVAITLQLPNLACRPIFPPQLFRSEQSPIRRDPLNPSSYASFRLQRHYLICMEPVFVVCLF